MYVVEVKNPGQVRSRKHSRRLYMYVVIDYTKKPDEGHIVGVYADKSAAKTHAQVSPKTACIKVTAKDIWLDKRIAHVE